MVRTYTLKDEILSKGNKKIDKSCYIYSHTPIKGCGRGCKDCKGTCYAKPLYDMRKQVKAKWDRNLELTKSDDLYTRFCNELKDRKVEKVRLMQAGDFYNDKVITRFYNIIKDNPQVTFYGYTKNVRAYKKLNKLTNCNIVYSYVNGYLNYGSEEYCELLHQKFGTYICRLDETKGEKCTKDCTACMSKDVSKNGVCFIIHGMHQKDRTYENSVIETLRALPDYKG